MEFQFVPLLATSVLDPIVTALHALIGSINAVVHNYGWSLILLAALVKLAFWPLNTMQFKAITKSQMLAPQIKALQSKYKNDKERLNQETMALYRQHGANPLAGCLPLLLQMPILFSLYWAVISDRPLFASATWLWIGSPLAARLPHFFAANLQEPDYVLLALYVVSMYFSVRFTSPAVDPQQAQQQKIMAFISPAMVGYLGFRYAWPSALILYWLSFNVFTMIQQFYLINRFNRTPAALGPQSQETGPASRAETGAKSGAVASRNGAPGSAAGGSRGTRKRRSRR